MNKGFFGVSSKEETTGIEEAPLDSVYYGRFNGAWTNLKTFFDTLYAAIGVITGTIKYTGIISPASLSSDQDDWNPTGLSSATIIRISASVDVSINGLAGGVDGRIIILENISSFNVFVLDEVGTSSAANRFSLPYDAIIPPNGVVYLQYNGSVSRWRIVSTGVLQITGDGVDNSNPAHPIVSYPTPSDIGAEPSLGYTAENIANKDTDGTLAANSDTKYASQKATKTYADNVSSNASVIAKVLTAFSAGAGTVSATDTILQAFQKVVGNIALKLTANSPITGATKTKITYDANGLVTAGADATTADIADSTNKRYVTDANLTDIGKITNLFGSNIVRKIITKTGIADNVATGLFTITTTNETGSNDAGGYSCLIKLHIQHPDSVAAGATSAKFGMYQFTRTMEGSGTGVNGAISIILTGNSVPTAGATRDVGTITVTVTETSEYVQTVNIQVDTTGSGATTFLAVADIEVVYGSFTTAPVLAVA